MKITTVKIVSDGYVVNGSVSVPGEQRNRHYRQVQEWIAAGNIPDPEFTPDELSAQERGAAKAAREVAVRAIKVTTAAGNTFDGDEVSQNRMSRAVSGLEPGASISWVLADNMSAAIPREELKEALLLAGSAATAIWVTNR